MKDPGVNDGRRPGSVRASSRVIVTDAEADDAWLDEQIRDAAASGRDFVWLMLPVRSAEPEAIARARVRLARALRRLRGWGVRVDGQVVVSGGGELAAFPAARGGAGTPDLRLHPARAPVGRTRPVVVPTEAAPPPADAAARARQTPHQPI